MRIAKLMVEALIVACVSASLGHAASLPLGGGRVTSGRWGASEVGPDRLLLKKQSPVTFAVGGRVVEHVRVTAQCRDDMEYMGMSIMLYLDYVDGTEESLDGLMIPRRVTDPVALSTQPVHGRGKPVRGMRLYVDSTAGREVIVTRLDVRFAGEAVGGKVVPARGEQPAPDAAAGAKVGRVKPAPGPWSGLWWTKDSFVVMNQSGARVTGKSMTHDGAYEGTIAATADANALAGKVEYSVSPPGEPKEATFAAMLLADGKTFNTRATLGGKTTEQMTGRLLSRLPGRSAAPASGGADFSGVWALSGNIFVIVQSGDRLACDCWDAGGRKAGHREGAVADGQGRISSADNEGKPLMMTLADDGNSINCRVFVKKKSIWGRAAMLRVASLPSASARAKRDPMEDITSAWSNCAPGPWSGLWRTDDTMIVARQDHNQVRARYVSHDGRYQGRFSGVARDNVATGHITHSKAPEGERRAYICRLAMSEGGSTLETRTSDGTRLSEPIAGRLLSRLPAPPAIPASGGANFSGVWWDGDEVTIIVQSDDRIAGRSWLANGRPAGFFNGTVADSEGKGPLRVASSGGGSREYGAFRMRPHGDGTTIAARSYCKQTNRWTNSKLYRIATLSGKGTVARIPDDLAGAVAERPVVPKPTAPGLRTLRVPDWGYEFDCPADWREGDRKPDGEIVYKPDFGQVEVRHVKLPAGVSTRQWADHVAKVYAQRKTGLVLKADMGARKVGDRTWHAHSYSSTEKRGEYEAYHLVTPRSVGVRVLIHIDDPASRAPLMAIVGSFRFLSAPLARSAPPPSPKPVIRRPETPQGARYATFGKHSQKGGFRGRVFLAHIFNKGAYPVYIAFHPVTRTGGAERSTDPKDYRRSGAPIYTATDGQGNYRLDLAPGRYVGVPYDAKGVPFKLLMGDKVFECSAARRLQHFKIDNRTK